MMSEGEKMDELEPCILVEGPRWADIKFYARWLLAVARADELWEKAIANPVFEEQVFRLLVATIPTFRIGATVMLSRLEKNLVSFVVQINEQEGEEFTMLAEMGFFIRTGQRYQMVVPTPLNMERVKKAALKLAQTEDADSYLHPEYLLATMPYVETKAWQRRLREMDEASRLADRLLLLGNDETKGSRDKHERRP